jgi:hypothetical protein
VWRSVRTDYNPLAREALVADRDVAVSEHVVSGRDYDVRTDHGVSPVCQPTRPYRTEYGPTHTSRSMVMSPPWLNSIAPWSSLNRSPSRTTPP